MNPEQNEGLRSFVLACRMLSKNVFLKKTLRMQIYILFIQFCKWEKRVFGADIVTWNTHVHLHSADGVEDLGPLHSIWLYSFKSCNGPPGKQPTNNCAIELVLMKRFFPDNTYLELLNTFVSTALAEYFSENVYGHACQKLLSSEF